MFDRSWIARLSLFAAGRSGVAAAAVGVHISDKRLAAVRLRASAALPTLESVHQSELDTGHSASAVRSLAQSGVFTGARVILTLPGGTYESIALAAAPAVPEEELRDALRWQLRGALPYSPEEATFDFVRLPQAARPVAGSASGPPVLVFAARRRDVTQQLAPFVAAGVNVEAVDIPEMAQRNLLGAGADEDSCRGFLSFDDASALLTVQLGDELCFARRMQLPNAGRSDDEEPEYLADRIATNVERSLEVFARQSQMPEVASLAVGPHPQASLIARTIAEHTGVAAALFDPATAVAQAQGLAPEAGDADPIAADVLLALGAALRTDWDAAPAAAGAFALPSWLQAGKPATA